MGGVGLLDPAAVQEYVEMAGWRIEPRLGRGQVAVYESPKSSNEQISIPINRSLQDFDILMETAISTLAKVEGRYPAELLTELNFPDADVLRFAETSHAAARGDVPFEHGIRLLNGAKKTLLAAACSAIHPAPFHPRMSFTEAEQFIQQCRLGQTERGSFVLTIACPLNAVKFEPDLFDNKPFTRRVTSQLMYAVGTLEALSLPGTAVDERDRMIDHFASTPTEFPLNANLCEGLLEMAPDGEESSLRITADYSKKYSGASEKKTVTLPRSIFTSIEYLARKLRPVHAPTKQVFVGLVETLNGRPNVENRQEGQVILRIITADSDALRTRVELGADDYSLADKAHMGNQPVSLQGVLRQTGRTSFRLDEVSGFAIVTG